MDQPKEFETDRDRPIDDRPDEDGANVSREDAAGNYYSGTESFFGVFTQTQVYLNGVRLVHDGKVTHQVSDLASQIENNRRRFKHTGDVSFALQEMSRITGSFNQRVQAWEAHASRRERNKKTMSGGALAKMKSELSMVRTNIRLASRMLTKLEVELHQIAGRESSDAKQLKSGTSKLESEPVQSDAKVTPIEKQAPLLSAEEQAHADECLNKINLFLNHVIGESLPVSFETANCLSASDSDRLEQVWDPSDAELPILLVAGWTVKHPNPSTGTKIKRMKLDLCFWLVPKSRAASDVLQIVTRPPEVRISSRKLDAARMTFACATEAEWPKSDLISGFLEKFINKYDNQPPTLLVAHFRNLEWTQKNVHVTCGGEP